jgi:hypothetical protein
MLISTKQKWAAGHHKMKAALYTFTGRTATYMPTFRQTRGLSYLILKKRKKQNENATYER